MTADEGLDNNVHAAILKCEYAIHSSYTLVVANADARTMKGTMLKTLKYTLAGILTCIVVFVTTVFIPYSTIGFPVKGYSELVIKNVNIVDLKNDTILQNQHILVEGKQIKEISAEPLQKKNDNQLTINGTGKYLIPALWDMHVHLTKRSPNSAYAQFVINGVMHVRDMRGSYNNRDHFASTPHRIRKWNHKVTDMELLGPIVHSIPSFAIEGPNPMFDNSPEYFNCANSEQAKMLVNYFQAQGVTLIKTYNNIPREAFFTLMREAKKAGIEVAGHKPVRVSTIEAANAGMRSMEHARFLIWDSFKGSQKLRNSDNPKGKDNTKLRKQMLDEHDTLLLKANLDALKNNNTYYCPTHLTRKADAYADDERFRARYDQLNPIFRFLSFEDLDATLQEDTTDLGREVYHDFYSKGLEITKTASDSGVKILAGSDVPELPGTSLIDELQELSATGLSNYEVLRTATLNPSEYYGLDKIHGTIEAGKNADLILLSQNPIQEISNLKSVYGIICHGTYLNKEEIGHLKQKIHSRNNGLLMSAKLFWDMLMYTTI
ncbi:amidohydrolase family protein [Catalinimonas sp. 4WD22]|uniref:amidohydrolase family protein n=1 Tax=Catalinimonas locisalis TaxID=3133978 RepID=UPI003101384A